jgi:hypothetical protein
MSRKEEQEQEVKQPIDMTTDEALDYIFAPEIVRELKREAGLCEAPETDDQDS